MISDFKSESTFACATELMDNHDVKSLNNKLEEIKESHLCAKEIGNFERAKKKGVY